MSAMKSPEISAAVLNLVANFDLNSRYLYHDNMYTWSRNEFFAEWKLIVIKNIETWT